MALQAFFEEGGRIIFGEAGRIEKESVGIGGDVSAAGKFRHRNAFEREVAEGAFGALEKHPVAVTDAHETDCTVGALQTRGTHEDFKFTGALAHGIAGRPRRRPQHRHARRRGGEGTRQHSGEQRDTEESARRLQTESDWHHMTKAAAVPARPGPVMH